VLGEPSRRMSATGIPIYRCPRCSREYVGSDKPPCCLRCLAPLERLVDRWHGYDLEHKPRKPRLLSAFQVRARKHARRPAGEILSPVFGETIPQAFFLVVTSPPSYGKSTWVLKALESGVWESPVLVVAEEGIEGVGLADRCARLEVTKTRFSDAQSFPEITELCEEHQPDCLALDSATALNLDPEDCAVLRRSYPRMTVVAVVQSIKSGGHAGSQAWKHNSDCFIELPERGRFRLAKSWFSELKEGEL
jgi:predicted ATP-dependent serine protease